MTMIMMMVVTMKTLAMTMRISCWNSLYTGLDKKLNCNALAINGDVHVGG